jgi:23S rRNA-/tRNA-specific pseudouridylate synthase
VYTRRAAEGLVALQGRFMRMHFGIVYEDDRLLVVNKPFDVRCSTKHLNHIYRFAGIPSRDDAAPQ